MGLRPASSNRAPNAGSVPFGLAQAAPPANYIIGTGRLDVLHQCLANLARLKNHRADRGDLVAKKIQITSLNQSCYSAPRHTAAVSTNLEFAGRHNVIPQHEAGVGLFVCETFARLYQGAFEQQGTASSNNKPVPHHGKGMSNNDAHDQAHQVMHGVLQAVRRQSTVAQA